MPRDELEEWKAKDPLIVLRKYINNDKKVNTVEREVDLEINEAIDFSKNSPEPSVEDFLAGIQD